MSEKTSSRRHVFIGYSHADEAWAERLHLILGPLLRGKTKQLKLWDDFRMEADLRWPETIQEDLAGTKVAVLLLSNNFMASEFLIGRPFLSLIKTAETEGVQVLAVSISPCCVEETAFLEYPELLPGDQYLDAMSVAQSTDALSKIAMAIRDALCEIGRPHGLAAQPPSPRTKSVEGVPLEVGEFRSTGRLWQADRCLAEGQHLRVALGYGVTLTLIKMPAGTFMMGSHHRVRLQGFWIGQTPITQAQWRAVASQDPPPGHRWRLRLKTNPSKFCDGSDSDLRPVEQISWNNAMEYCRRLSALSGDLYTLPSEAQWEYACRAGSETPYSTGHAISPSLAKYDYNGGAGTTPVGTFPANAWGLIDMHGNVEEWCLDHWHSDYRGAPDDGSAWLYEKGDNADLRMGVLRGGTWYAPASHCRSSSRHTYQRDYKNHATGLRVCCFPRIDH